jgi:hypothetical protein
MPTTSEDLSFALGDGTRRMGYGELAAGPRVVLDARPTWSLRRRLLWARGRW